MASFSIPLTGLQADSTALNTIANDLANMNTTAFKAQTTSFSDLFYQQVGSTGSGDLIEVGAGTQVASNQTDFTQGSYDTSGTTTSDVALDGDGFFVVSDGSSNLYTRDGAFTEDTSGNLVTANGLMVMGYPATNGVVDTNAALTAIQIPLTGQVQQPAASTSFTTTTNLDSETASGSSFPAEVTLYDSLGVAHTATITYTAEGNNTWSYSVALPTSDFASGVSTPVTGTMTFDQDGNLEQIQPSTSASAETVGTASGDVSSLSLGFAGLADGAADLAIQWNLLGSGGTPTISQVDSASAQSSALADGYATGTYSGFSIGSDGTISATYSNGQTQIVGQLALANMTNLQGLALEGSGNYATTLASGPASIGVAGVGGLGTIEDSTLEASNVNISSEFSDLIVAQRAFEANAKSVTTFDSVTQDTINMVH